MKLNIQIVPQIKLDRFLGYKTSVTLDDSLGKLINHIKKKAKKFNYNYEIEIVNDKTPSTWSEKLF